jgi:hypothetical protein
MMKIAPYRSTITLNVIGYNFPIKRHRLAGCIKKKKNKTQPFVACRKCTSLEKKNTGLN